MERTLGEADIEGCMRLVAEAGWNQTANDWNTIFEIGEARGVFEDGELVASAAVVRHDPVGWVCMVLVTPAHQRRGLATHLLNWAGGRLDELGLTPGLDATPAGRHVYSRMGYQDIYGITRMQIDAVPRAVERPAAAGTQPLTVDAIDAISALDLRAFGADRGALLKSLVARRPEMAIAAYDNGGCHGFVLAREGRRATQVGPLVAEDEETAIALLGAALQAAEGQAVFIDVVDRHRRLRARLEELGFSAQRPFTRMLRGRSAPFDDERLIFALTGPEFA